ncbi:HK97 gp10 family phage protein [Streptomyces sp. NPDC056661]|uniref:HK97 gp10 family phage protein n=1 Tax=Streptomyces sp. NPDC056661 TaxID=3345898 RepID=UPI0036BE5168
MGAFEPNRAAIDSLVFEDFVQQDLHDRADRVVDVAKATAPVLSGRFQASIHAEDGPAGSVLVVSDLDYSVYVELGTRDTEAHNTIATALDAARD